MSIILPDSLKPFALDSFFVGLVDRPGPERKFFWRDGAEYRHGHDVNWHLPAAQRTRHPWNFTRTLNTDNIVQDLNGRSTADVVRGTNLGPEVWQAFELF